MNTMHSILFPACSLIILAAGCTRSEGPAASEAPADTRPRVRVCALTEGVTFEDTAVVQGSVRTKFTAAVASRLAGTVDEVLADEGDTVAAGTPLFQVDRVNLENRVAIARDDQAVAAAALEEAKAAVAEAEAAHDKAKTDEARYSRLYNDSASVTKDAWEKAQLQLRTAAAALARAQAAVATAEAKIQQAATALRIAEKNLADSRVPAPFDGIVTAKLHDRGDFVSAGTPVFTLDDPRVREACFTLTADRYADVAVGRTQVRTSFGQTLPVTYKSPTVSPASRTFEIRVTLAPDPAIAPGMLCGGEVVFASRTGAGVPASAMVLRDGRQTVYTVDSDGVVQAVPVAKGASADGLTEVLDPAPLQGAAIVAEGMLLLNPGDRVKAVR